YRATSGYDLASGLGSPIANLVIRDLVAYGGSTSFNVAAAATTTTRFRVSFAFNGFGGFDEAAGASDAAISSPAASPAAHSFTTTVANLQPGSPDETQLSDSGTSSDTQTWPTTGHRRALESADPSSIDSTCAAVDAAFANLGAALAV